VILGNPPWIKVSWSDSPLLSDFDPLLGVQEARSAEFNRDRTILLQNADQRTNYLTAQRSSLGSVAFLNCHRMYEALRGSQTNLYKNFIVRSWGLLGEQGLGGLLHQEGTYDDAKGGRMRDEYYHRLVSHIHFKNEMKLFSDVHNEMDFSLNVFRGLPKTIKFLHLANLYTPVTLAACRTHTAHHETIPGLKNDAGEWETKAHLDRMIIVTEDTLSVFHSLLEDKETPIIEARLPHAHAKQLVKVIDKINQAPKWLPSLEGKYYATELFHESNSQQAGILTRQDHPSFEPADTSEWVVSGPHFFVGTPLNKSPRSRCQQNKAYDDIDLTTIAPDYLPRSVYRPGNKSGDIRSFLRAIPSFAKKPTATLDFWLKWHQSMQNNSKFQDEKLGIWLFCLAYQRTYKGAQPLTIKYRYVNRRSVSTSTERTLISAIMPTGMAHIHPVLSLTFLSEKQLISFASCTTTVVFDFLMRAAGRADIYDSNLYQPKVNISII
jgi:hypothetical protein